MHLIENSTLSMLYAKITIAATLTVLICKLIAYVAVLFLHQSGEIELRMIYFFTKYQLQICTLLMRTLQVVKKNQLSIICHQAAFML